MKKRNLLTTFSMIIISIILILPFGCTKDNDPDNPDKFITLGVVLPMDQQKGELRKNALVTAIDEINDSDGVGDGYRIDLIIKSSEGADRKVAAADAAQEIIAESQNLVGFITTFSSSTTGIMEDVAIPGHYPTLSGSATASSLTAVSKYFSRLCPPDPFEANVLANQANEYGINTVAIAAEGGDAYSVELSLAFQKAFGGGAPMIVNFIADDPDYDNKLNLLLKNNPEAIFISMLNPGVYTEFFTELGAVISKKGLNNTSFILCDGLYSTDLFQAPIDYILGEVNGHPKNFGAFPSADTTSGAYIYFKTKLFQKYNQQVASYNAQFYDIGFLYAMAIEKTFLEMGTGNMQAFREKVNDYIRPVSTGSNGDPIVSPSQGWKSVKYACQYGGVDYTGASGNCNIDNEGNAVTPYSIFQVKKPGSNYAFEIIKIIP